MMCTLLIRSRGEMVGCAEKLANQLQPGDLLLINGALGAGKTFFAQGVIRALGVDSQVTSPTFVMVKSYSGKIPINHIDAYRLLDLKNPTQAFEELDVDSDNSLTIVEWGEGFDLTGQALQIHIEIGNSEERTVTFEGADSRWAALQI